MGAFGDREDLRSRVPAHDLTEMLVVALAVLCRVLIAGLESKSEGGPSWIDCASTCHYAMASPRTTPRATAASNASLRGQPHESYWPSDPAYRWSGLRSLAMVESIRDISGVVSTQRCYYISSLPADAAKIAHAVRSHWRIENAMPWVLDMTFDEDQSRVRIRNAAQNFAILRRIAMNLLRRDASSKASLRNRRLVAGASDDYRALLSFAND